MTATAIAKARAKPIHPGQAMTLRELLEYCHVRCVHTQRKWFARGRMPVAGRWIAASGETPIAAVMGLLWKIGGE